MTPNSRTLQASISWRNSVVISFVVFAIFLVATELLARSQIIGRLLNTPSMGSVHKDNDRQWVRFEYFASNHDSIDCVFLGDSTILTGLDPDSFEEAYFEQTGENLECFNFGIGGLTAVGSTDIAQILVREYQPRLLVIGIHVLGFSEAPDSAGSAALLESPWLRYKSGKHDPEGWLFEHSYLYRYRNFFSKLLRMEVEYSQLLQAVEDTPSNGFHPLEGQGPIDVSQPPEPDSDQPYDEAYFAALTEFQVLPVNLAALDQLLKLDSRSTRVLAVELPVADTFYYYFGNGEEDYKTFINDIDQKFTAHSATFWQTSSLDMFPYDAWFNRNHLNTEGAEQFSKWLGEWLGEAVVEGKVSLPSG